VLRPGDSATITVFFRPTIVTPTFTVYANKASDPTPVDYSRLSPVLRRTGLSDSQWSAVFARFQSMVGPTSGDYVQMLARNATQLPPSLGDARDPVALAELEVRRAEAAIGTSIAGTLKTTDPQVSLAGRTVDATNSATRDVFTTTSLNDGTFLFEAVTPGSYTFRVDQAVEAVVPPVAVAAGQAAQGVTLSLSLGGVITGSITSANALGPVGGATVEANSGGTLVTRTTDPNLRYLLEEPPPEEEEPPPEEPGEYYDPGDADSNDPNEKTGAGVGAAGFVAAGAVMPYSVAFENDPKKATAAAQEVTVTDPLSPNLDWTTFTLGDITFGANVITVPSGLQSYTTSVNTTNTDGTALRVDVSAGINPATGVVTWTFRSIDPTTGQLPTGVQDGFLPIDDATGRGLGTVYYDVKPRAGLPTGTNDRQHGEHRLRHQRRAQHGRRRQHDRRRCPHQFTSTRCRPRPLLSSP